MKVYLVQEGSYDGVYHHTIHTTREGAEAALLRLVEKRYGKRSPERGGDGVYRADYENFYVEEEDLLP